MTAKADWQVPVIFAKDKMFLCLNRNISLILIFPVLFFLLPLLISIYINTFSFGAGPARAHDEINAKALRASTPSGQSAGLDQAKSENQSRSSLLVSLQEKLYRVYSDGAFKAIDYPEVRRNNSMDLEFASSPDQRYTVIVVKDQCSEEEDSIHILKMEEEKAVITGKVHRLRLVVPYRVQLPVQQEIHDEFVSWSADSREIIFKMTPVECAEGGGAPGKKLKTGRYVFYELITGKTRFLDMKADLQFIAAVPGSDLLMARQKKEREGGPYFSEIIRIDSLTGRQKKSVTLKGQFDTAITSRNQQWVVLVPFQPVVGRSQVVLDSANDSLRIINTPEKTYISGADDIALSPSGKNVAYKVTNSSTHRSYLAVNDHIYQQREIRSNLQWIDDDRLLSFRGGRPAVFQVIDVRLPGSTFEAPSGK